MFFCRFLAFKKHSGQMQRKEPESALSDIGLAMMMMSFLIIRA